jgi:hypothetical protein
MLQFNFVDSGETRETIFVTAFNPPAWVMLMLESCISATNVLADGLLVGITFTISFRLSYLKLGKIWRCYYAWNRSLRAISLPFFFVVAETGEIPFKRTRRPD